MNNIKTQSINHLKNQRYQRIKIWWNLIESNPTLMAKTNSSASVVIADFNFSLMAGNLPSQTCSVITASLKTKKGLLISLEDHHRVSPLLEYATRRSNSSFDQQTSTNYGENRPNIKASSGKAKNSSLRATQMTPKARDRSRRAE